MLALVESDQYASGLRAAIAAADAAAAAKDGSAEGGGGGGGIAAVAAGLRALAEERQAAIAETCGAFYRELFGGGGADSGRSGGGGSDAVERLRAAVVADVADAARRIGADFAAAAAARADAAAVAEHSDRARRRVADALRAVRLLSELQRLLQHSTTTTTKPLSSSEDVALAPQKQQQQQRRLCEAVAAAERARVAAAAIGRTALGAHVAEQLPAAEEALRAQAAAAMGAWLSRAWDACGAVGAAALGAGAEGLRWRGQLSERTRSAAVAHRQRVAKALLPVDALSSPSAKSLHGAARRLAAAGVSSSSSSTTTAAVVAQADQQQTTTTTAAISAADFFADLHEAVHVYRRQGRMRELREQYADAKRQQVSKLFHAASASAAPQGKGDKCAGGGEGGGRGCSGQLQGLAGFFAIERAVASVARDLQPAGALDELWRAAVGKVKAVVLNELASGRTTAGFAATVDAAAGFAEGMRQHGYDVGPVLDFLPECAARYAEVAYEEFCGAVDAAFQTNAWSPLVFATTTAISGDHAFDGLPGPLPPSSSSSSSSSQQIVRVAFSALVPEFCRLAKGVVVGFFAMGERLGDVERLASKTADQCVQRVVRLLSQRPSSVAAHSSSSSSSSSGASASASMGRKGGGGGEDELKIGAQMLADLLALTGVPRMLESFIGERCTWGHTPSLEVARRMLESAQGDAEAALKTAFQARFDQILAPRVALLSGAASSAASSSSSSSSSAETAGEDFVGEVKRFVESARETLGVVTGTVSQAILSSCLRRVADTLITSLLSDHVRKIPYGALVVLQTDLRALEQVSGSVGFGGGSDPAAHMGQALQVVRVLLRPDAAQIADLAARPGAHAVVADAGLVSSLLEKVKEDKSAPAGFGKLVKATLKELSRAHR